MAASTLSPFGGHRRHFADKNRHARIAQQRGAAALVVTMLLVFAMLLVVAFANRNVVVEARTSANQYRSTQAFEAAEAGLEWTLAQLGNSQGLDPRCMPSADPLATSFRQRYLGLAALSPTFTPVTWLEAGASQPLQPACVRTSSGWACSCPGTGRPDLSAPVDVVPAPAFRVTFEATGRAGVVRATSVGCTSLGGPCAPEGPAPTDASARVEILLALLPALRTAPAAALTVRGEVHDEGAGFAVANPDVESGGLAIHAGSTVDAERARFTVPAGAALANAVAQADSALSSLSRARFFASYFGLDKLAWSLQPNVRTTRCSADCTATLQRLIDSDRVASLVYVDGDVRIDGPATLGSAQRPVVIVANGAARLRGAVALTGVLYANAVSWDEGAGTGGWLRGALLSESDYRGDAAPEISYDAAVLARLKDRAGTFARVNGSWKDH